MPVPPPDSHDHPPGDDCRCLCGNLLARVVDGEVELKCRRCKRTLRVPIAGGDAGLTPVRARPEQRAS